MPTTKPGQALISSIFKLSMEKKDIVYVLLLEYILRLPIEDYLLNLIFASIPCPSPLPRVLIKPILLRRLVSELNALSFSLNTLHSLELLDELHPSPEPSNSFRKAYCATAIECTVCLLRSQPENLLEFRGAVKQIWVCRVGHLLRSEAAAGLGSKRLNVAKKVMEMAVSNSKIRDALKAINTKKKAWKAVRVYVDEEYQKMGPSVLQRDVRTWKNWRRGTVPPPAEVKEQMESSSSSCVISDDDDDDFDDDELDSLLEFLEGKEGVSDSLPELVVMAPRARVTSEVNLERGTVPPPAEVKEQTESSSSSACVCSDDDDDDDDDYDYDDDDDDEGVCSDDDDEGFCSDDDDDLESLLELIDGKEGVSDPLPEVVVMVARAPVKSEVNFEYGTVAPPAEVKEQTESSSSERVISDDDDDDDDALPEVVVMVAGAPVKSEVNLVQDVKPVVCSLDEKGAITGKNKDIAMVSIPGPVDENVSHADNVEGKRK